MQVTPVHRSDVTLDERRFSSRLGAKSFYLVTTKNCCWVGVSQSFSKGCGHAHWFQTVVVEGELKDIKDCLLEDTPNIDSQVMW